MKINRRLLLSVFNIQNPSRNLACNNAAMSIITSLAPKGCTIVRNKGNMLIRKGDPHTKHPYFVAHMDQVHGYIPYMTLEVSKDTLRAVDGNGKQCGVGGDDKCGIYLALQMLHHLPNVTAVFVRDEEVGCIGSGEVPMEWFSSASFVIQADRNNQTFDIISDTNGMNCASEEFMDCILSVPAAHRHSENTGSMTDIGELASRGLEVSAVNISSGYHDPHSARETVRLSQLVIACEVAYQMATLHGDTVWSHTPTPSYGGYGYGNWGAAEQDEWKGRWEDHFKDKPSATSESVTVGLTPDELQEWMWDCANRMTEGEYCIALIRELVKGYGSVRSIDDLRAQGSDALEGILQGLHTLAFDEEARMEEAAGYDNGDYGLPDDADLSDPAGPPLILGGDGKWRAKAK